MKINFDNNYLNSIDLNYLYKHCVGVSKQYFLLKSGKEPYRLLVYLSSLFNNSIIIDLGTSNGASALALSYNKSNQIVSFDIIDRCQTSFFQNENQFEKCRHSKILILL